MTDEFKLTNKEREYIKKIQRKHRHKIIKSEIGIIPPVDLSEAAFAHSPEYLINRSRQIIQNKND